MTAPTAMTKTVWIYESGDTFKTFDSEEEAQAWFDVHDPEGVAFRHEVSELRPGRQRRSLRRSPSHGIK